tara:strand:+ start:210 stop:440 length:231 start_codon:yes stop_codon:yes gene_type:complete
MKIKLNKSILIKGEHFEAGIVHDVEDFEGQLLISQGRAIEAVEECSIPEASLPPAPPTASKISSKPKKVKASVNSK